MHAHMRARTHTHKHTHTHQIKLKKVHITLTENGEREFSNSLQQSDHAHPQTYKFRWLRSDMVDVSKILMNSIMGKKTTI